MRSLDQDSPSSFSENELDAVSLSSYVTSYGNVCLVILLLLYIFNKYNIMILFLFSDQPV